MLRAIAILLAGEELRSLTLEPSLITSQSLFEIPAHIPAELHVFQAFR